MARLSFSRRSAGVAAAVLLPAALLMATLAVPGSASEPEDHAHPEFVPPDELEYPDIVQVFVDDRTELDALVDTGVDLGEMVNDLGSGLQVEAIITPSEQEWLRSLGFDVGAALLTAEDFESLQDERDAMVAEIEAAEAQAAQTGDDLRVQRAAWFENHEETFVEIEVWSEAGSSSASVILTVALDAGPGTEIGDGATFTLSRLVDAGHYMFHRTNTPRQESPVPSRMRVTSTLGGEVIGETEAEFTEFLDGEYPSGPGAPKEWGDLATGFVDHYVDATESTEKIEALASEFPDIAEIIEMPHQTNGYRRKAQAIFQPPGQGLPIVNNTGTTHRAKMVRKRPLARRDGGSITITQASRRVRQTCSSHGSPYLRDVYHAQPRPGPYSLVRSRAVAAQAVAAAAGYRPQPLVELASRGG
jgi:hypothetical protein